MVNEGLLVDEGSAGRKREKRTPTKPARTRPEDDVNNADLAQRNKATDVRMFAVQRTKSAEKARAPPSKQGAKYASGAFANSPSPNTLPMPKFNLALDTPKAAGLLDPAIVSSSKPGAHGFDAPIIPAIGSRVKAHFDDGDWYDATVQGYNGPQINVVYDGYEHDGVYSIDAARVRSTSQEAHLPAAGHVPQSSMQSAMRAQELFSNRPVQGALLGNHFAGNPLRGMHSPAEPGFGPTAPQPMQVVQPCCFSSVWSRVDGVHSLVPSLLLFQSLPYFFPFSC